MMAVRSVTQDIAEPSKSGRASLISRSNVASVMNQRSADDSDLHCGDFVEVFERSCIEAGSC